MSPDYISLSGSDCFDSQYVNFDWVQQKRFKINGDVICFLPSPFRNQERVGVDFDSIISPFKILLRMWTFAPTTERRVRETEIDGMYGAPKSNLFEQRYRAKPGYCKTGLRNHRYRWKIERMFNRECLKFLDMPESSLKVQLANVNERWKN